MEYEERLIVFVDILGFKSHIDQSISINCSDNEKKIQGLYESLNSMREFTGKNADSIQKNVTQFSDSLIISFRFDFKQFRDVLSDLENMLFSITRNYMVCRGAAVVGKIIHTEQVVFGPGLVEAIQIEKERAIFPRIILEDTLRQRILMSATDQSQFSEKSANNLLNALISKDDDGIYYLDYFGKRGYINYSIPINVNQLRLITVNGLKNDEIKVRTKYEWMQKKFNQRMIICNEEIDAARGSELDDTQWKNWKYLVRPIIQFDE